MSSEQTQTKPKKVCTPEMLHNLELAREKARLKRKEIGELTQLRKKLAEKTKAEEIAELKAKLGATAPEPESESDPEPEPPKVKKPKKKTKKPIVIVEESETDSEDEQVVYIKRKSAKPRTILQEEPLIEATPPPPPAPPQSPYHGLHPSMLTRRRF